MGSKSNNQAPDYSALAASTRESAQIMAGLGREQLDFAKTQYAELSPIMKDIAKQQMAAQTQQMTQAKDYYDYQTGTFRPVEKRLVESAQNFNTEAYRNQLAAKAAADAGRAFSTTQAASNRAMAGMGINPNSGRFAGIQAQNTLGLAAQRANAMTGTRQQAEQLGYARQLDVTGLGRGLPGASTAAYAGATGAGTAAGNTMMAPGNQYMAGMNTGASTIGSGLNMQNQGLASVLNAQQSGYNAAQSAADPYAAIAGMALGGWASGGFKGLK